MKRSYAVLFCLIAGLSYLVLSLTRICLDLDGFEYTLVISQVWMAAALIITNQTK